MKHEVKNEAGERINNHEHAAVHQPFEQEVGSIPDVGRSIVTPK